MAQTEMERLRALTDQLNKYRYEYYVFNAPTVSDEVYDRLFDELNQLEKTLGTHMANFLYHTIGIHCCANSDHQWANLREVPNLKMLNFVRSEADTRRAVRFFADSTAQYHNTVVDIRDMPNASKIHLAHYVYTDTFKSAVEIVERFRWNCLEQ